MGRSGKRKGYRPRSQKQQLQDAARLSQMQAAAVRKKKQDRCLLAICAVLVALALAFGVAALVRRCAGQSALSTPHCQIDSDMFSYYFYDYYIAEWQADREGYTAAGLDPAKPLSDQKHPSGGTWEGHFLSEVKSSLRRMLVFAETAYRQGTVNQAAARSAADERIAALQEEAAGRPLAEYLASRYGVGEAAVRRAEELSAIAEAQYAAFAEKTYTAAERQAWFEKDPRAYYMADLLVYTVKVDLTGVSGETAMREEYRRAEQRAQAIAAATDASAFLAAIKEDLRAENPALTEKTLAARVEDAYQYHIPAAATGPAAAWAHENGRQTGDTAALGETGNYTVVFCLAAPRLVESYAANAQYILVPYSAYMTEELAKEQAHAIMDEFARGPQSSAAFTLLAEEYGTTESSAFTAVTYGEVDRLLCSWLVGGLQQAGDSTVIAGREGYYVLYHEGYAALPLWEELVADSLREEEYRSMLKESGVTVYDCACTVPALVPFTT